jgi:hypothetical protein
MKLATGAALPCLVAAPGTQLAIMSLIWVEGTQSCILGHFDGAQALASNWIFHKRMMGDLYSPVHQLRHLQSCAKAYLRSLHPAPSILRWHAVQLGYGLLYCSQRPIKQPAIKHA